LDYIRSLVAIDICVLHQRSNMVKVFAHLNAKASVCVLAGLHNPQTFAELGYFVEDSSFPRLEGVSEELLKLQKLRIV